MRLFGTFSPSHYLIQLVSLFANEYIVPKEGWSLPSLGSCRYMGQSKQSKAGLGGSTPIPNPPSSCRWTSVVASSCRTSTRWQLNPPLPRHSNFGCWGCHTFVSFQASDSPVVPPCRSTWWRWVVDTFTLSDMSRLGSPEGGGADFGSTRYQRLMLDSNSARAQNNPMLDHKYARSTIRKIRSIFRVHGSKRNKYSMYTYFGTYIEWVLNGNDR